MRIVNFGSLNLDYVYRVPRFPAPGETLGALEQRVVPGGKGLNQSVALARAGAEVFHAGLVGAGGETLRELLREQGVDVSLLRSTDTLQGNAVIQVNDAGENCILLFGGSNRAITKEQVAETLGRFGPGDLLVLQNEVSCLPDMIDEALARGMKVALNPSPFDESLRARPLDALSWLFINEVEGAQLTGKSEPDRILERARALYPSVGVVLTLGSAGAVCSLPGEAVVRQPAYRVNAVDTTAAGDTFTGYFLASWAAGETLPVCLKRAAAASAISVGRPGASPSIPMLEEVLAFIEEAES